MYVMYVCKPLKVFQDHALPLDKFANKNIIFSLFAQIDIDVLRPEACSSILDTWYDF